MGLKDIVQTDPKRMRLTIEREWDGEEDIVVPARWEVCGRCNGRGVHDHEAFSDGFTAEDFAEDPDFAEDYLRGVYDVPCSECDGRTTVLVPNEHTCPPDMLERYQQFLNGWAQCLAEEAAERRMGA